MTVALGPGDQSTIRCRNLTLREVRALPRIPSGYVTNRVFRVFREVTESSMNWRLHEEELVRPLEKQYDTGSVDDWLDSYEEAADPTAMRFTGAFAGSRVVGIMTWKRVSWNNTLWLADLRVKAEGRRSGTGSQLIAYLQREAVKVRARGVRLETQVTNYPAIRFYQKHGFVPSGLDDHLYSNRDIDMQDVALFLFWECPYASI